MGVLKGPGESLGPLVACGCPLESLGPVVVGVGPCPPLGAGIFLAPFIRVLKAQPPLYLMSVLLKTGAGPFCCPLGPSNDGC